VALPSASNRGNVVQIRGGFKRGLAFPYVRLITFSAAMPRGSTDCSGASDRLNPFA